MIISTAISTNFVFYYPTLNIGDIPHKLTFLKCKMIDFSPILTCFYPNFEGFGSTGESGSQHLISQHSPYQHQQPPTGSFNSIQDKINYYNQQGKHNY